MLGGSRHSFSLSELREGIKNELDKIIAELELSDTFLSTVRYGVLPSGKVLRPLLATAVAMDLGASFDEIKRTVCSIELLHCSSLIHDDLPALDNDDTRRGEPSCHRAHGEADAILAGDFLISYAFSLALQSDHSSGIKVQLVDILSKAFSDLCHGQHLDLQMGDELDEILKIHSLKTAALFKASTLIGATFAEKTVEKQLLQCITDLGFWIGLYFQAADDKADIENTCPHKREELISQLLSESRKNVEERLKHFIDGARLMNNREALLTPLVVNEILID